MRALLAVEGLAKLLPDIAEQMETEAGRERVLTAIRRTEDEPSVLGLSSHVLAVADVPHAPAGHGAAPPRPTS